MPMRPVALLLLAALCACTPVAPADASAEEAAAPALRPEDTTAAKLPGTLPDAPGMQDPLAGVWWVLAPSHPYLALRLSLVGTDDDGVMEGHWISFDWRATAQPEALARRSKAVLAHATREGPRDAPTSLVIEGGMPMLDENGAPNGQSGRWHIELTRANLPGEPLRLRGRAVHSTLTAEEGVDVDLVRDYRAWSP